jgi:hypothetical protein
MSANLLTVATTLGATSLGTAGDALEGWDEFDPADSKARSGVVKAMAGACFAHAKADARSVKKGTPAAMTALPGFSTKCSRHVARSGGVYDGPDCATLGQGLEFLLQSVSDTARGR